MVYLDANYNGHYDAGEAGAPNVTVVLDGRFSVQTDATGRFDFPAVATGHHVISVVPDNLPLPWVLVGTAGGGGDHHPRPARTSISPRSACANPPTRAGGWYAPARGQYCCAPFLPWKVSLVAAVLLAAGTMAHALIAGNPGEAVPMAAVDSAMSSRKSWSRRRNRASSRRPAGTRSGESGRRCSSMDAALPAGARHRASHSAVTAVVAMALGIP